MKATFHPEALDELIEAMAYYQNKRKGLGDEFYEEVDTTIKKIEEHPERWPVLLAPIQRCRTDRFPYKLVYQVLEGEILIVALMHDSREPGYWLHRI